MGKKTNNPSLSLCMIVKDEEVNLERFFSRVKGYFSEIIVVDTGSSDRSVEIAKNNGAKVYTKQWNDDFSGARNESLKHARGDWIVVLDADEYLDQENYDRLSKYLRKGKEIAYYLNFKSKVPESKAGAVLINSHPRVFKNGLGITYKGRIHEQIIESVFKAGGKIEPTDVIVEHSGYQNNGSVRKQKIERNIAILLKEISENPENGIYYFYLGEEYSLLFEWEKAINYYEEGVMKNNLPSFNRALLHQNLATAYLNTGQEKKAIKESEISLELNNTLYTPYLIMAESHFKMGNYNSVTWHLENLLYTYEQTKSKKELLYLHHEPNFTYIYTLFGDAFQNLNNLEKAELSYRKALEYREDITIYISLMKLNFRKKNYDQAFENIKKALKLKPDYYELYLYEGELYFQLQNYEKAKASFIKSMLSPENREEKRYLLGLSSFHLDEYGQALNELKKNENHVLSLNLLCDIYTKQGKVAEVEAVLKKIKSLGKENALNYFNLGLHYEQVGKKDKALEYYEKSVEINDKDPQILFYFGTFLLRERQTKDALKLLSLAGELSPETPEIWHNIAVAHIKEENYEQAIEAFMKLLVLTPSDKGVKRKIASVYAKMGDIENAERYLMMSKE